MIPMATTDLDHGHLINASLEEIVRPLKRSSRQTNKNKTNEQYIANQLS
jgi:hypothetical protein